MKYPTFSPDLTQTSALSISSDADPGQRSHIASVLPQKLAEAYAPIRVRHHYHHGDDSDFHLSGGPSTGNSHQASYQQKPVYNTNPMPQSLTPAPTPPPSPKPKKQQYQTDQTRPFLFPFSRRRNEAGRLVPFAIDEADQLYSKHMHVSTSLMQMWRTREDCMIAESGLQSSGSASETFESALSVNSGTHSSYNSERRSASNAIVQDIEDPIEEHQDVV